MNINRRMVVPSILLPILLVGSVQGASRTGWDGTWSGAWGGKATEATSITIAGQRVVSYEYQGVSHPVANSKVTPAKITYEDQGNTVTLIRKSETTASAALHSDQGDGTAELTRK
jgi:hypothetical protein